MTNSMALGSLTAKLGKYFENKEHLEEDFGRVVSYK